MRSRSLLLVAPQQLEWVEEVLPPTGTNAVLVETIAGAVSIGTELPLYHGNARSSEEPVYPRMTGYESLGRVVEVGQGVSAVAPGDLVLATYGHRTAALVPEDRLVPVPDGIPLEVALLAILSCDAATGIGKLVLDPEDALLITGAGTIGLLALHRLRWLGYTFVDVVEPDAKRRELAATLGARNVFSPAELKSAEQYAAGLECSSRNAAFTLLQGKLRRHGQICVLADGNLEPLVLDAVFHERELLVVGSSDGVGYPDHAQAFYEHWLETRPPLDVLFEWRVAAPALPAAFARMLRESPPLKVLVNYLVNYSARND